MKKRESILLLTNSDQINFAKKFIQKHPRSIKVISSNSLLQWELKKSGIENVNLLDSLSLTEKNTSLSRDAIKDHQKNKELSVLGQLYFKCLKFYIITKVTKLLTTYFESLNLVKELKPQHF